MPKLSSHSLDQFLQDLGSSAPVPGGGAAAALVLAQAAALGEMVARLNLRRAEKQGVKRSPSAKNIAALAQLRKKYLVLMESDAKIFLTLSKFTKESRQTAAYQNALKKAAAVPHEMCLRAEAGVEIVLREKPRTSTWLYSDLVESALLFEAGFEAARLNVEINLASITDGALVSKIKTKLKKISSRIQKLKSLIGAGP